MKAKGYVEEYKKIKSESDRENALATVYMAMVSEIGEILKQRKAKETAENYLSVTLEISKKWNAFRLKLPGENIKKDGFLELVFEEIPELKLQYDFFYKSVKGKKL